MKPLIQLLEILPYDMAASFLVEIGRQNDSQQLTDLLIIFSDDSPESLLIHLFEWSKSRQGSDYWHKVFQFVESQQRN